MVGYENDGAEIGDADVREGHSSSLQGTANGVAREPGGSSTQIGSVGGQGLSTHSSLMAFS